MDYLKKLSCSHQCHKSCLTKLFSRTDEILVKSPNEALTNTNTASVQDYIKQLQQKVTVFADIDKKIVDHLEDEDEFEAMAFKSEDLQTMLSQKILLLTC